MPVKVKAPHETTVQFPGQIQHHNLSHIKPPKKPMSNPKKIIVTLCVIIVIAIMIIGMAVVL